MAIVKKLKQHPPLPPSRYEVGIYCRVSTASKTQVVSIGHQLSGLIADVANSQQARLYDVYLDIQSGRTSDNRKNLMRLLDDCRAGRVTLVYTKSISRFARNTVDVLTIVRELKKMNVPVHFENEQLYSFDKEAELAISLYEPLRRASPRARVRTLSGAWIRQPRIRIPSFTIENATDTVMPKTAAL
ncbi:MAG: recombinase family protein [Oliverpabstia sp.]